MKKQKTKIIIATIIIGILAVITITVLSLSNSKDVPTPKVDAVSSQAVSEYSKPDFNIPEIEESKAPAESSSSKAALEIIIGSEASGEVETNISDKPVDRDKIKLPIQEKPADNGAPEE